MSTKSMSAAELERVWIEGLNRGDLSSAERVFAHDCIVHMTGMALPIAGVEQWKQVVSGLVSAFPDIHFTLEEQMVLGDRVAARWHAIGTHSAPFGPVPATGRSIAVDGMTIDHIAGGKVAERWEQWDQSLLLQQLGVS